MNIEIYHFTSKISLYINRSMPSNHGKNNNQGFMNNANNNLNELANKFAASTSLVPAKKSKRKNKTVKNGVKAPLRRSSRASTVKSHLNLERKEKLEAERKAVLELKRKMNAEMSAKLNTLADKLKSLKIPKNYNKTNKIRTYPLYKYGF